MSRRGVSDQVHKALIRRIGAKVKGTKVGTMVTTTVRVIMSEMVTTTVTTTSTGVTMVIETTTMTTTSTGVTMETEMIVMGPMSLLKIVK